MGGEVEERDDERAPDATDTDAVTARTRALVEESRQLLQRLERLLGRDGDGSGDAGSGDGDDDGDGDATEDAAGES